MDFHNSTSIPLEPLPLADCFAKNLSLQQTSLPGGTANRCEKTRCILLFTSPTNGSRPCLGPRPCSCLSCSEASFTGIVNVQSFVDRRKRGACGVSAPHDAVLLFRQKDPKPWAPGRSHARRRPEVAPWDGGGYNYQRRRGKAALDAATTTEKERMEEGGMRCRHYD